MKKTKPGWKTTEFWLSLVAMIIAALAGSGAFAESSAVAKVLAFAGTSLAALGYTAGRALVKSAEVKGAALVEAASKSLP